MQARFILAGSALSAAVVIGFSRLSSAGQTTEHPYMAPDDIKSETCLTCHPDKKEGKAVHTAVGIGCESCHQTISQKEKAKTTITLLAQGGELCALCHQASKDPVQHGPYKAGQCLTCHNPHSSNFPRQIRAAVNTLCGSCHATSQPDVKVNVDARTVSLLDGRTLDLTTYEKAPRVEAGHAKKYAAFVVGRPLGVNDARKQDAESGCLACHDPHAGKAQHLLHGGMQSHGAAENYSSPYGVRTHFIGGGNE